MSQKKVVVITSTGDISESQREFFSNRYAGMEIQIISIDTSEEIKLTKYIRKGSATEVITIQDILTHSQLDKLKKAGWVITVWSIDRNSGKPMYPFKYSK